MAVNVFLKFDEPAIEGESTDSKHAKEIQVLSWSHSFNQPTKATRSSAGGGTVEQANHSDFTFSKYLDTATDDLLKYCWNGKQIGKATLTCYRSDGDDAAILYLQVDMEDIIISNISQPFLYLLKMALSLTEIHNIMFYGIEEAHHFDSCLDSLNAL